MSRKLLAGLAKLLVTALLIGWLAHTVNFVSLRDAIVRLDKRAIAAAFLLVVLQTLILGWRWHRIVHWLGARWPFGDAVRWVFVGLFFNQVLPSSVGGDAVRMWVLHQRGVPGSVAFGSVAIERGTGVLMMGLMISACAWILGPALQDGVVATPLLLAGPALLALLTLAAVLDKAIGAWLPRPIASALGGLGAGLRQIARTPSALFEVAAFGAAATLSGILAAVVLGRSLGIDASLPTYIAMVGGAALLSVLPLSLGGWGLREAAMVTLFASVGVPAEPVLTMSVVWGLLPLIVSLPAGAFWWTARRAGHGLGEDRTPSTPTPDETAAGGR